MEVCERCFICGTRVTKGNLPNSAGSVQERMNKLISVSRTVEHSSTIISDILSRILNETVMREETICRICFNLLNDIDYHLKEAQEKTDEITCKFLDKEKDPNKYQPTPIITAADEDVPLKTINIGMKKTGSKTGIEVVPTKSSRKHKDEDEMSVNSINKNKQKLLISVLHPSKKPKLSVKDLNVEEDDYEDEEDDDDDEEEEEYQGEEDSEEYDEDYIIPSNKKYSAKRGGTNKKSGKRKKPSSHPPPHPHPQPSSSSPSSSSSSSSTSTSPSLSSPSMTNKDEDVENRSEYVTVNMDDLGDLFSKPKEVFFAKKSEPFDEDLMKLDYPIQCNLCDKVFKRKSNLQIHLEKVHHENNHVEYGDEEIPETHRCDLCPREFVNEASLALHRTEHENAMNDTSSNNNDPLRNSNYGLSENGDTNAKAKCPKCNKTFKRVFNMRIHIDRVHNKSRPFGCNVCDKTFATNSDLKQHMTVHGRGKVFKCEECGREFTNRDSIILHRKQHSNHRTHFCNVCDKGFFKASCLTRHLRTHTGEKPFKCEFCGKSFTQSTTVKVHKLKCQKNPTATSVNEQIVV